MFTALSTANSMSQNHNSQIITCNGRIDLALAKNGFEMIQAASRAATALVVFYGDRVTDADTKPISELQHKMMKSVESRSASPFTASDMCDDMFALLDKLKEKMDS